MVSFTHFSAVILRDRNSFSQVTVSRFLPSPDALPVAVQPAGEAAAAEMVHAIHRPGEEEGGPGHDDVSVGPSTAFLQLPPMEGPQDRLQEVPTRDTAAFFHLCYNYELIFCSYVICILFLAGTDLSVETTF